MNRPLIVAAIGLVAVALAIGLNYALDVEPGQTEGAAKSSPASAKQASTDSAVSAGGSSAKAPASATAKSAGTAPAASAGTPTAQGGKTSSEQLAALVPPSFDVVRVNPQGDSVMAGRAAPGATVLIMESGKVIGQVVADTRGEWVFVPDNPLNPGDRQLTLEMQVAGQPSVKSDEAVVLVVPQKDKDIAGRAVEAAQQSKPLAMKVPLSGSGPTVVLQKPRTAQTGETTAAAAASGQAPQPAPGQKMAAAETTRGVAAATKSPAVSTAVSPGATASKSTPTVAASGGRKLPPLRAKPQPAGSAVRLTVDTVDYDDAGRLTISGQARDSAIVQVYLNNGFIGRSTADAGARWVLSPGDAVAPGLYALRADQVDTAGKVVSRVVFPFARAEPLTNVASGDFVIVQPGNSLWQIARRTYGAGTRYTTIFEANKEQIKDADLIYPGQIFTVPPSN